MCTSIGQQLDQNKADVFAGKMLEVINHAGLALMISIGHRTKLFDTLAGLEWVTSHQLAEAAGLNERYVREWLGAMVTGGIVEYREQDKTHRLPAEHAAWLTRAASPNNLAVSTQFVAILGIVEDEIVAAFQHGQGVPYSSYPRFHQVMAEESQQSVVSGLVEQILPLAPGLSERLTMGIDVLDIGCGSGRAMMHLAEKFPHSRFVGEDFSEEAISTARAEARRRGLTNITFRVQDAAAMTAVEQFDLVTAFDAIHDQARPAAVLGNIARALRPEGLFLMQDISGTGHVHTDCSHPVGPFLYTISCMHCMSVSLAMNGPGLGAMWGKELALQMLGEAGLGRVRVETLAHDPMNFWYFAER
ncbi:8-demethylnovobiocic acid C(8)-methyltransferase [Anatilimnocola aggregata]|uniref:8-demethylnovobiocic acid C(8)-methyltransferase n=1 Tax=Anatilimnocola aggregata TaxID=2528021 RepID=A0A517YMU1_9BACT|nr:class I SAM-dependent methyltransferase [Anatilimnocola aggregata]QDU31534.1 8-demethylnovobiocic acid C(8)-methyltransferase [Anatilimnocola aggregata]